MQYLGALEACQNIVFPTFTGFRLFFAPVGSTLGVRMTNVGRSLRVKVQTVVVVLDGHVISVAGSPGVAYVSDL